MLHSSNFAYMHVLPTAYLHAYYGLTSDVWQAEADFSSLAERLRDGEGQRADWDRAARDALTRSAQAEAQLQTTEVPLPPYHCLCSSAFVYKDLLLTCNCLMCLQATSSP